MKNVHSPIYKDSELDSASERTESLTIDPSITKDLVKEPKSSLTEVDDILHIRGTNKSFDKEERHDALMKTIVQNFFKRKVRDPYATPNRKEENAMKYMRRKDAERNEALKLFRD